MVTPFLKIGIICELTSMSEIDMDVHAFKAPKKHSVLALIRELSRVPHVYIGLVLKLTPYLIS
jgi:hypothetical protein